LKLLVGWQEGHPACKKWVVRYCHGYLSGARCKWFAYGSADATASPSFFCDSKIQNGLPFWCRLNQVVLEKRTLNGCSSSNTYRRYINHLLAYSLTWLRTVLCGGWCLHMMLRTANDACQKRRSINSSLFPQIDIIRGMMIVWRLRGKIIRSVLCNIVCNSCAQCNAHTYERT